MKSTTFNKLSPEAQALVKLYDKKSYQWKCEHILIDARLKELDKMYEWKEFWGDGELK